MSTTRQYNYDKKRAEINKLELNKRKSKRWKQIEKLVRIREKAACKDPLFNPAYMSTSKFLGWQMMMKLEKYLRTTLRMPL